MFKRLCFGTRFDTPVYRALHPVLLLVVLALLPETARAHVCGPSTLELTVGQTASWQITADVSESSSQYTPTNLGNASVVTVTPNSAFTAFNGVFSITAVGEGSTTFTSSWMFGGQGGTCSVTVNVTAGPVGQMELSEISTLIDSISSLSSQDKSELQTIVSNTQTVLGLSGITADVQSKMLDVLICALADKLDGLFSTLPPGDEAAISALVDAALALDNALLGSAAAAPLIPVDLGDLVGSFFDILPPANDCQVTILVLEGNRFVPPENGRATIRSFFSAGNKQLKAVGTPEGGTYRWSIEPNETVVMDDGKIIFTDKADLETFGDGSQASTNLSTSKAVEVIKSGTSGYYDQYTVKVKYTAPNQSMCEDEMEVIVSITKL